MMSRPDESKEPRPAGPVGAGDPPPPAVAKASSGAVPPTPPPAGGAAAEHSQGSDVSDSPGASEAGGEQPDAGQEVEADLEQLLADTQRERDEYLELAKRTKADFENFRKRMAAEVQAAANRGRAEFALGLIDAIDNLERALQAQGIDAAEIPAASESAGDSSLDGFAHGVVLVLNGMRETLRRNGVEALDPTGEAFDPQWHEALSTQAADGAESGTVIEVIQKGYRFGDQLVRPARVVVAE